MDFSPLEKEGWIWRWGWRGGPGAGACPPVGHRVMGSWSWLARAGSPELGVVLIFGSFLFFLPPLPREELKPFLCPQAISLLPSVFLLRHQRYLQRGGTVDDL